VSYNIRPEWMTLKARFLLFYGYTMSMQIEGKVLLKTPVITVGDSKLAKQSIHIEEIGVEYPQSLYVDFL
jgi:hypothetical protein